MEETAAFLLPSEARQCAVKTRGATMKPLPIIVTALLFSVGGTAAETFKTGNELLDDCMSKQSVLSNRATATRQSVTSAMECMAYIAGVNDALDLLAGKKGCVPTGVTLGQISDVVVQYLQQKHLEMRHGNAAGMTMLALRDTWCPAIIIKLPPP
jgi:hypothetical protein